MGVIGLLTLVHSPVSIVKISKVVLECQSHDASSWKYISWYPKTHGHLVGRYCVQQRRTGRIVSRSWTRFIEGWVLYWAQGVFSLSRLCWLGMMSTVGLQEGAATLGSTPVVNTCCSKKWWPLPSPQSHCCKCSSDGLKEAMTAGWVVDGWWRQCTQQRLLIFYDPTSQPVAPSVAIRMFGVLDEVYFFHGMLLESH